jgi:hypothetical protein
VLQSQRSSGLGAVSLGELQKRRNTMPILWLLGIPIPLIILIMLLHH